MEFILYFLLRRYFVKLSAERDVICLRKGLLFQRNYRIPKSSIIRADIRRAPLLRLLRGKKVILYTFAGKITFYLHRNEPIPLFSVSKGYSTIKPRFSSVLAGAFSRTKALGGTIVFSVALIRTGSVLGSGYYDVLSELIKGTAQGLEDLLSTLRIAVPRITTILAVFVAAAWIFAFLRNLLCFSRFRIYPSRNILRTSHGVITLYETLLVLNDDVPIIQRDTIATLLTGTAPVYIAGALVLPPLRSDKRRKAMRIMHMTTQEHSCTVPPPKALFGHIAVPLGWGASAAALLILTHLTGSDPVLRTVLWTALLISAWFCILYAVYMRRSGYFSGDSYTLITARHGTELLTATIPRKALAYIRLDSNPFQRRTGMCDLHVYSRGTKRVRLRNVYAKDISAPL